jgi:hypothetical protein
MKIVRGRALSGTVRPLVTKGMKNRHASRLPAKQRNFSFTSPTTSSQRVTDTLKASTGQWRSALMARRITWHGTTDEALALLHALREHCECRVDHGRTVTPCASHSMLARDQRAVDGLLFMRRMAVRLLAEEFDIGSKTAIAV